MVSFSIIYWQDLVTNSANYVGKQVLSAKLSELSFEDGLTPRQAVRTKEFVLLSLKIMLTEMVFFYLLFVYKVSNRKLGVI